MRRLAAVCLSEGVTPSNEGRGSALRSVMRRAVRHGVKLGITTPFLDRVAVKVADTLGAQYPDLVRRKEFIANEARAEELAFREKIPQGLKLIGDFKDFRSEGGRTVMPGAFAFKLYETYGFPLDLTEVIGEERGFVVDRTGFDEAAGVHTTISRPKGGTIAKGTEEQYKVVKQKLGKAVEFTGYDAESGRDEIALILRGGELVEALGEGEEGEIVTRKTPFYGESGGQVGDVGTIRAGDAVFEVTRHAEAVRRRGGSRRKGFARNTLRVAAHRGSRGGPRGAKRDTAQSLGDALAPLGAAQGARRTRGATRLQGGARCAAL